jgi:hypothetical protein
VSNAETQNSIETKGFINNDLQIKQVTGAPKQVRSHILTEVPNKRQIVALGIHRYDSGRAVGVYIENDVWDQRRHQMDDNFVQFLLYRSSMDPYVFMNMLGYIDESFVVNTTTGLDAGEEHVTQFIEQVADDLFNSYGYVKGAQTRESTLLFASNGRQQARESAVVTPEGIKPFSSPFAGVETRNCATGNLILEAPYKGDEIKGVTAKQLAQYAAGEVDELEWQQVVQVDGEILDIGLTDSDNTVILTTAGDKRLRPVRITWENDNSFSAVLLDKLSIETSPDLEKIGNVSQIDRDGNVLTTRGENRNGIGFWPVDDLPDIREMLDKARNAPAAE